jgi:hypothetical protein
MKILKAVCEESIIIRKAAQYRKRRNKLAAAKPEKRKSGGSGKAISKAMASKAARREA